MGIGPNWSELVATMNNRTALVNRDISLSLCLSSYWALSYSAFDFFFRITRFDRALICVLQSGFYVHDALYCFDWKVCLFDLCYATVARAVKFHIIRIGWNKWKKKNGIKSAFRIFIFNQTHSHLADGKSTMSNVMSFQYFWWPSTTSLRCARHRTSELSLSGRWLCHTLHLIIQAHPETRAQP